MKTHAFWILLCTGFAPLGAPQAFANAGQVNPQVKKTAAPLQLLDKAWAVRKQPLPLKLSFMDQLLKELESQNHTPENRSRMQAAVSLVALSEKGSELAAAELFSKAAKTHPLKLNKNAAKTIWREFQLRLAPNSQVNTIVLADVAEALSSSGNGDLDTDYMYFLALSKLNGSDSNEALAVFSKMEPSSTFFRRAKLHEGLILAATGKNSAARSALEMVVSLEKTEAERKADTSETELIDLKERAILNLARIHFENKEFKEALSLYRSIDSASPYFYESLTEQGWAFFMAGHPNRALGIGYGATSPHFNQQFQPDQYFLKATVNYWLCDFPAARKELEQFVRHTREDAKLLRGWGKAEDGNSISLAKQYARAYDVTENHLLGVSAKNNSLGPKSLETLGRNRTLRDGLIELNTVRAQRQALSKKLWSRRVKNLLVDATFEREKSTKEKLGKLALSIIRTLQSEYERSVVQMRIIHLEIMTAEKDRLMKTGRSVQGQQFSGTEQEFLDSFQSGSAQLWADNKKEFWKDELDSFVFSKKSQCEGRTEEERDHGGE